MVPGIIGHMARCTAPVHGHRTASGRSGLPCMRWPLPRLRRLRRTRTRRTRPRPTPRRGAAGAAGAAAAGPAAAQGHAGREPVRPCCTRLPKCGHSRRSAKASRSERPCLTFGTSSSAMRGTTGRGPPRSCTICSSHAVSQVWFSEKDVGLGTPLLRAIDKGLAKSRIGIVLVTPALLRRLPAEGIADKELSALLARDRLVPIVHDTTYEALREVSPLLGLAKRPEHCRRADGRRRGQARRAGRPLAPARRRFRT